MTHCPPIVYDSLVRQLWATAKKRTIAGRPQEIVATIDGKEFVVYESSVRASLQLNDGDGLLKLQKKKYVREWPKFIIQLMVHLPFSKTNSLLNGDFLSTPFFNVLVQSQGDGINLQALLLLALFAYLMGGLIIGQGTFFRG